MEIRKYQTPEGHCIIKSDTYCHTVNYINQLVALAKADFPSLQDNEISIKVYNDDRWGKQTAIEFKATAHPEYADIHKLPYTFN